MVKSMNKVKKEIYLIRSPKIDETKDIKIANLLLISDGEKQHYCWIKNMSRLLSSQVSDRDGERHFCLRCLNSSTDKDRLKQHKQYCDNHDVKTEMPEQDTIIKFKNFNRSMRVPL